MDKQTVVVVSRNWQEREIFHRVTHDEEGIRIELPLADFLAQVAGEVGPMSMTWTRAQLAAKLSSAANKVVHAMKNQTIHCPPQKGYPNRP